MPSSLARRNASRIALAVASAFLVIESCNAALGCICPLIFDPVCDSKGTIVAGNTCEASCKELPEGSYDRAWCGGTRGGSEESLGWVLPPKLVSYGYSDPEYDGVVRSTYPNERYEALLDPSGDMIRKPSLEWTPRGYLAAWSSGINSSKGGSGVEGIFVSRKGLGLDEGWSSPELALSDPSLSLHSPTILYDMQTDIVHLFAVVESIGADASSGQVRHFFSSIEDGRLTFRKMQSVPIGPGVEHGNRIIKNPRPSGGWWYPYWQHQPSNDSVSGASRLGKLAADSLAFRREFSHKGWPSGLVEPTVVSLNKRKHLKAFFRDNGRGYIWWSDSINGGRTWSAASATEFPNNGMSIQAATLGNGALLLAFNPLNERAYRLSIAVSLDGGESWPIIRDLECAGCNGDNGDRHRRSKFETGDNHGPEFSSPSILEGDDGRVHVTYVYSRSTADMSDPLSVGLRDTVKYVVLEQRYLGLKTNKRGKARQLPSASQKHP